LLLVSVARRRFDDKLLAGGKPLPVICREIFRPHHSTMYIDAAYCNKTNIVIVLS